jgi:hypothetical protein
MGSADRERGQENFLRRETSVPPNRTFPTRIRKPTRKEQREAPGVADQGTRHGWW